MARLGSANSSEPQPEEPQPQEPAKERGEGEARRPSIKPGIKTNMVAREVRVNASGMRPGKTVGEREVFTEEASSILVRENGGVIQLSADVARGQLLLLTNVESRREVVAQVKRSYKPANRCVELEFAEPAPRFWGMTFSAATALLPKDAKYAEAVALLSAGGSGDEPTQRLAAPTAEEVQALKRDVKGLTGNAYAPAKLLPVSDDPIPTDLKIAAQVPLPAPLPEAPFDFAMALPKPTGLFRARGKFTPGAKLRLAALTTALLATIGGAMWIKDRMPGKSGTGKASAHAPAVGSNVTTSPAKATRETPRERFEAGNTRIASDAPALSPSRPIQVDEPPDRSLASNRSTAHSSVKRTSPPTTLEAKARVRPPAETATSPVVAATAEGIIVPARLIKSVKAVASLDDLRDFETGNVVIDAVVGTDGEVHFITVITGPPSLRSPAVEAVKQYRYEPAMRNGQPVPEHVHITVRFRFES